MGDWGAALKPPDNSVPVLVACLVFVFVFLGSVIDSCKFVVILLFVVLILFFLDKSL